VIIVLMTSPQTGELNMTAEGSLPGAQPITPPAVRAALVAAIASLDQQTGGAPAPVIPILQAPPRRSNIREVIEPTPINGADPTTL
jgi:hypothetical protein